MSLICQIIEMLLVLAPVATAIFAGYAVLISNKTLKESREAFGEQLEQMRQEIEISKQALEQSREIADEQITILRQEWQPYLSYVKMDVKSLQLTDEKMKMSFSMQLKNVGRCVLRYEVTKFIVEFNRNNGVIHTKDDVKQWNNKDFTTGVIGINSDASYRSAFHSVESGLYPQIYILQDGERLAVTIQCKIDFTVAFWRADETGARYELSQTISLTQYQDREWREVCRKSDIREIPQDL